MTTERSASNAGQEASVLRVAERTYPAPLYEATTAELQAHGAAHGFGWPFVNIGTTGWIVVADQTNIRKFLPNSESTSEQRQDLALEKRIY